MLWILDHESWYDTVHVCVCVCVCVYVPLHVLYVQYALYHTHREYLLSILLHLTLELMKGEPPHDKDTSLAGSLSAMLLKVHVRTLYIQCT